MGKDRPGREDAVSEQRWLTTDNPYELTHHRACRSHRKRRLLACAFARRVLFLLPDDRYVQAVEVAERYADGMASEAEMRSTRRTLNRAGKERQFTEAGHHAAGAVLATLDREAVGAVHGWEAAAAARAALARPDWNHGREEEVRHQCALARDVFRNPYQPVLLVPAWQTPTVLSLAQAAYDDRTLPDGLLLPDRLAILADALEEVGCDHAGILDHLRQPAEHVRGCWLLDLLLRRG
jgi:hypothetical protein